MIACLMIFEGPKEESKVEELDKDGESDDDDRAIEEYGQKRTSNKQGLTICS